MLISGIRSEIPEQDPSSSYSHRLMSNSMKALRKSCLWKSYTEMRDWTSDKNEECLSEKKTIHQDTVFDGISCWRWSYPWKHCGRLWRRKLPWTWSWGVSFNPYNLLMRFNISKLFSWVFNCNVTNIGFTVSGAHILPVHLYLYFQIIMYFCFFRFCFEIKFNTNN